MLALCPCHIMSPLNFLHSFPFPSLFSPILIPSGPPAASAPTSRTIIPKIQMFTAKNKRLLRNILGAKVLRPRNSRLYAAWSQRACYGVSLAGGGTDVGRGKREVKGGGRCGRVNLLERRPKVLRLSRHASEKRGERSKGGKRG